VARNAVQVLRAEGIDRGVNVSSSLTCTTAPGPTSCSERDRYLLLQPGQLVVINEASMIPTVDLTCIIAIAKQAGAKALVTGDAVNADHQPDHNRTRRGPIPAYAPRAATAGERLSQTAWAYPASRR
jgi:hypothetical protein